MGHPELADAFRVRALVIGVIAGALALAGLLVERHDAHHVYEGLTRGAGLGAVIVSALAGLATMALVWMRRYGPARATAAAAVGAILVGWVLAQRPDVLPGLSIHQAAAGRSTLIALVIATAIGAVLLVPSLVILYGFLLGGVFDRAETGAIPAAGPAPVRSRLVPVVLVLFGLGAVLTVFFDASATLALGILLLFACGICGFLVLSAPVESDRA
jgi:cytochrome d ubiquinol oxidase subunit II